MTSVKRFDEGEESEGRKPEGRGAGECRSTSGAGRHERPCAAAGRLDSRPDAVITPRGFPLYL